MQGSGQSGCGRRGEGGDHRSRKSGKIYGDVESCGGEGHSCGCICGSCQTDGAQRADAIVAEGCESGGHIGELTTMALVPQVVDAVDIPVIAAGVLATGAELPPPLCLEQKASDWNPVCGHRRIHCP